MNVEDDGPTEEQLLADPVLGRIVKRLYRTESALEDATKKLNEHGERLEGHEATWLRSGYANQLREIAAHHNGRHNKDGKGKPFDQEKFLGFAIERGITDLGVAYRAFALGDDLRLAAEEAEERGRQRGRRERHHGGSSGSPWGAPSIRPPHLGNISSLQELTDDQVLADPDIRKALSGEGEE